MFYGDFRPIADTAGFIIVHPMGTVDLLGNTHFNVGWGTSQIDDLGFTADLIDSFLHPIRSTRTGFTPPGCPMADL